MLDLQNDSYSFLIKTSRGQLHSRIATITAHNDRNELVILKENSKVLVAKVIPQIDNVLQHLSECLQNNRNGTIEKFEGVTHDDKVIGKP